MAERDRIEQLNQAVDAVLAGGEGPALLAALRDLPGPEFRARLKSELMKEARNMMTASYIRPGLRTVTPYLHVDGAGRFLEFVRQAFGAEETFRTGRPDGTVMHAEVKLGDSMLEVADAAPSAVGLHLYVPDVDDVYRRAVAAGGASLQAPRLQPYGDREAAVRDPFGNNWYIATHQGASYRPEGLHTLTPYLHPRGVGGVIEFVQKAFDAEVAERHESPDGVVQHAKIRIGDSLIEMGEPHGEWGAMPGTLHLYVEDADALYRRALEAGATSLYEPADTGYGDRGSGVVDPFGNQWYIHTYLSLSGGN